MCGSHLEAHPNGSRREVKVYVLIQGGWDIMKNMYLYVIVRKAQKRTRIKRINGWTRIKGKGEYRLNQDLQDGRMNRIKAKAKGIRR